MPGLSTNEAGCRHHVSSSSYRPRAPRRCQKPSDGAAIAFLVLPAEDEIQPHAGDFDDIAIVEAHGAGDGGAVDFGHLVTRAEVVAVITLIDLRRHCRLEPALQANGGQG